MTFKEKSKILDKAGIDKAIERMAHEVIESSKPLKDIAVIGIKSRGAYIGERLAARIGKLSDRILSLSITMANHHPQAEP